MALYKNVTTSNLEAEANNFTFIFTSMDPSVKGLIAVDFAIPTE